MYIDLLYQFGLLPLLFESYCTSYPIFVTISGAYTAIEAVAFAALNIAVICSVRTQELNMAKRRSIIFGNH